MITQKHLNKARTLYQELKFYHLNDPKWQNNYIAKWRNLAKKVNTYSEEECNKFVMMYIDIVSVRTNRTIMMKGEK